MSEYMALLIKEEKNLVQKGYQEVTAHLGRMNPFLAPLYRISGGNGPQ